MRVPLSWIRDFAPFGDDAASLAASLDELGLVVEEIVRVGQGLEDVVVARVDQIDAIAGADRIRQVVVDAGDGPVQVVCGAWNFSVGDLVWIEEHRPISKLKRWTVVQGQKKASVSA